MQYLNFDTKQEAQDLCDKVSKGEGYPLHKDSQTINYCEPIPIVAEDQETITGWKVIKDEITNKYI